ncbi:MAG TPA: E2/UBC family protein [Paucimonas sp.]|nr:E2/UBC family protein [Paucimonas sp.]
MPASKVEIIIDRKERSIIPGLVEGRDLINLAALSGTDQLLFEISGDIDVPVLPEDAILIRGGEKFSIGDGAPQVEDNPCLRHPIHFHFNNHPVTKDRLFPVAKVTGAQLKQLDPNLQSGDALIADLEGLADESIRDDQRIILQRADRFITVPCGNVGFDDILEQQLNALQAEFPTARLEQAGGSCYVVVPDFLLPEGFTPNRVSLLFILPNGFPMAAPDMFWVEPCVSLADGREPEGASQHEQHLGQTWQRFSWHYTHGQAAWRIGHSSLTTHVQFCRTRFTQVK